MAHPRSFSSPAVSCFAVAVLSSLLAAPVFAQRDLPAPERSIFTNEAARARYEPLAIRIWAGRAPDARGEAAADTPRLFPVLPTRSGTHARPAILVLPGGAYRYHSATEAFPIAEWFRDAGFAASVLEYRLRPYGPEVSLQDAQQAVRLLRARAKDFNLDPATIAAIGFSAGGHLAANLSTHGDDGNPVAADPVERAGCRIQSAILFYPAILDRFAVERPASGRTPIATLVAQPGLQQEVDLRTAPTFLITGYDDNRAPYENTLAYAAQLHAAGVRFELHLLGAGDHGAAVREARRYAWEPLVLDWLKTCGFTIAK